MKKPINLIKNIKNQKQKIEKPKNNFNQFLYLMIFIFNLINKAFYQNKCSAVDEKWEIIRKFELFGLDEFRVFSDLFID
jgi:hypothetical protein